MINAPITEIEATTPTSSPPVNALIVTSPTTNVINAAKIALPK